jgi:hypothetical protein
MGTEDEGRLKASAASARQREKKRSTDQHAYLKSRRSSAWYLTYPLWAYSLS